MFGWGRKSDGFEWHKHVRTTIKLRREDRRARLLDAKEVAADSLKYAGRAGVSAGNNGAILVWNGSISAVQMVIRAAISGGRAMSKAMRGTVAPGFGRLAGALGGIPAALGRTLRRLPLLDRLPASAMRAAGIAGAMLAVAGGGYLATRVAPSTMTALGNFRLFAPQIVEGKATAIGGDALRINTTTLRLAGIEAPEADQKCVGANKKKWSCGEAAASALQKQVKGRTVRCELSGSDATGRPLATCQTGTPGKMQDIAASLVKEGAVFAQGGLFASYSALENEAQARKAGIWKGEAERPADYRSKIWETAAKSAPEGCPIKGQVAGEARTYVLPWSPDYNGVRVRTGRGERWFCTESEAQAAGWKMASR